MSLCEVSTHSEDICSESHYITSRKILDYSGRWISSNVVWLIIFLQLKINKWVWLQFHFDPWANCPDQVCFFGQNSIVCFLQVWFHLPFEFLCTLTLLRVKLYRTTEITLGFSIQILQYPFLWLCIWKWLKVHWFAK